MPVIKPTFYLDLISMRGQSIFSHSNKWGDSDLRIDNLFLMNNKRIIAMTGYLG